MASLFCLTKFAFFRFVYMIVFDPNLETQTFKFTPRDYDYIGTYNLSIYNQNTGNLTTFENVTPTLIENGYTTFEIPLNCSLGDTFQIKLVDQNNIIAFRGLAMTYERY